MDTVPIHQEILSKTACHLSVSPLTAIEYAVCSLLFLGNTAKEIATIRNCSFRTIEKHIENIKMKIGGRRLSPIILVAIINAEAEAEAQKL